MQLFLTSSPPDSKAFLAAIAQRVEALSHGWRALPHYLYRWNRSRAWELVQQNVREGSGVLLDHAPASIARAVIGVCQQHGVTTKHFGDPDGIRARPISSASVFFIGSNYVIAEHFSLRAL